MVAKTVDLLRQYTGRYSVADVIQSGVIKATCLRINLHNGITWLYACLCLVTLALTIVHIFAISSSSLLLWLNQVITVQWDVTLVAFNCAKQLFLFFLKNLKQQMLPENKLGGFQCSRSVTIERQYKDTVLSTHINTIAKELIRENKVFPLRWESRLW